MAAAVILVDATPRRAVDGVAVPVRLAGGGAVAPYHYGGEHYRAGIAGLPKSIASLDFDGEQLGGGGVAQALELRWSPGRNAPFAELGGLFWSDAPITVRIGPEGSALPPVEASGLVLDASADDGVLRLVLADQATDLKRPALTDRHAGTGGIEGPIEWEGQIKQRAWGRCFNVPGRVIKGNIWCFGDPRRPWRAFVQVRTRGVAIETLTELAWKGSAEATFAALDALTVPAGTAVACPSIACVKWWTDADNLHADIHGETAGGYVETAPAIAARIITARSALTIDAASLAAAIAARPAPFGWRIDSEGATAAGELSQMLADVSLSWLIVADQVVFRPWQWSAPRRTARSHGVTRRQVYKPVATRKLGYRRNWSPMARGDLAAIVLARDVVYEDGDTAEAMKPATPGATAGAPAGTTIGGTIRPDGSIEGGMPAVDLLAALDAIEPIVDDLAKLAEGAVITDEALQSLVRAGVDRDGAQRLLGRGSDMLAQAALRLALDTDRQRVASRDAGLTIDPATGKGRLFAVEDAVARTAKVEITLDAQAASIRQRATYTDLERAVADAQLEGKDVDLSGLYGQVSDLEINAEALAGAIELRATTAEVNELGLTVSEVEQRLDSLGDEVGVTTDVRKVRRLAEDAARAMLGGLASQDRSGRAGHDAIVQARQELTARMDSVGAGIEARATTRLGVAVGAVDARLIAESRARIEAGEVLAEDIEALAVTTGEQAGVIADLSKASIDQEGGLTVVRSTQRQQAALDDQTAEALLASLVAGERADQRSRVQMAQVQTELSTELVRGRLSEATERSVLSARLGATEAEAARLARAQVDGDRGNAESIERLSVRVDDPKTGLPAAFTSIADVAKAVIEGDELQAQAISEVTGKLEKVEGSVTDLSEVVIGPEGAAVRAMSVLNAQGRISGFAQTNDGRIAAFEVTSDSFALFDPDTDERIFYVDRDGAVAARFQEKAIGAGNLADGAAQRATYFKLPQNVVVPRNHSVTINLNFVKQDADSDVEIMFYGHFANEDDLSFDHDFLIDGAVHQYTPPVRMIFDERDSRAATVITPFTVVEGLPAGPHSVSFRVANREDEEKRLTIAVGAILKCVELRQASLGSSSGSIGPVVAVTSGGGGSDGGGGGGGGISLVQQN